MNVRLKERDEKGKEKKLGVESPKLRRTASFQDDAKG